ncbi:MAG: right-handed parallel beta-helix repeat-containing protein [Chitinophagaceae bacterium]|nr:right-handed parallel beta-helix repeat-containing protein [Chitinophagaceae bacterium]
MRLLLLLALATPAMLPAQRLHKMPARSTGELYVPAVSPKVHPGDTIQLAGKYSYIYLNNVQGTADKPVIIHAPRPVQVGQKSSNYGMVIQGRYWKLLGYGHLQVYNPEQSLNVLLSMGNSQHASIDGVQLRHGHVGILARPDSSGEITDISISNCQLQELRGTRTNGRSSGILIGVDNPQTADTSWYTGVRIADVTMTDLDGVGIFLQACRDVHISRTRITGYGQAKVSFQDMAVLVGAGSQASLYDCQLQQGHGCGLVWKGHGRLLLRRTALAGTGQADKADALYLEPTAGKKATAVLDSVQITGAGGYGLHVRGQATVQQRQLQISQCKLGKWHGTTPAALRQ